MCVQGYRDYFIAGKPFAHAHETILPYFNKERFRERN